MLTNELKWLEIFSTAVCQKKMCTEFTIFLRVKRFIDDTTEYLPRLLKWVGQKIIFWQTDLGSNVVQNNVKNIGVKRSLAVTSNSEKKHTLLSVTKIFKVVIKMMAICVTGLILKNRDVFFVVKGIIIHILIVKSSNLLV